MRKKKQGYGISWGRNVHEPNEDASGPEVCLRPRLVLVGPISPAHYSVASIRRLERSLDKCSDYSPDAYAQSIFTFLLLPLLPIIK